jgi:flagellar basal body rod protein FlgG
MMQSIIQKTILSITLSLAAITGFSQTEQKGDNLYLYTKSTGEAEVFSIDEINKITFSENGIQIWNTSWPTEYSYSNVRVLTFDSEILPGGGGGTSGETTGEMKSITIGKSGKASYCGDKSLDFSGSEEIKAYIATGFDKNEEVIWLTRVKDVPAGTPVLIKGVAEKTYQVPVINSQNSYYKNMFKGNTSGDKIQVNETEGGLMNYYLASDGTFKSVKGYVNIGNNKSYLQLPGTFKPTAVGTTQTVKVGSAGKASYAAPVDLDFTNVEGLKAFAATGYDKSSKTIWLTRVMKVQKGEGILLKGNAKDYQIPSAAVQSSYMNMFVGNTSGDKIQVQATSDDGSQTNFYLKGDGTFVSVNGYVNIGNNKCYLALPTSMVAAASTRGAEANYIMEEPEVIKLPISFRSLDNDGNGTTAIRETKQSKDDGAYYTLQGQRVENPGKGLYIKNGKKVVIK